MDAPLKRHSLEPLLSVLIPTKNRPSTAIEAILQAVKIASEAEIEIVVQDCSDNSALEKLLIDREIREKVRYFKSDPVSMTENWNIGLSHTLGEYVVIIGDDDTILPSITDVTLWAKNNGYAAIATKNQPYYYWPDFPIKELAGNFFYKSFSCTYELREAQNSLEQFSRTGDDYQKLPSPYHGLIKRAVLEKIRQETGHYLDSLSPDMYSPYAIALYIDRYVMLDYPIRIHGASSQSNTGRNRTGEIDRHIAEYEDFQFTPLAPNSNKLWAQGFDSMVRAFLNTNHRDMFRFIDIERVFARTIISEPTEAIRHIRKFVRAISYLHRSIPMASFKLVVNIIGKLTLMLTRVIWAPLGRTRALEGECIYMPSIAEAVEFQQKMMPIVFSPCPVEQVSRREMI